MYRDQTVYNLHFISAKQVRKLSLDGVTSREIDAQINSWQQRHVTAGIAPYADQNNTHQLFIHSPDAHRMCSALMLHLGHLVQGS